MTILAAPNTVTLAMTRPGLYVTVICAGATDVLQVAWSGPGGVSGLRVIRNTVAAGDEVGPFADNTIVVLTALSGLPDYDAPMPINVAANDSATSMTAAQLAGTKSMVSVSGKGSRIALLGNSITSMARPVLNGEAYTAGNWTLGGAITAGQTMLPPTMDLTAGIKFIKFSALNSGAMGANEPVWPLTVGATVTDGAVTWQAIATTLTSATFGLSWWSIAQALTGQLLDEVFFVGQPGRQSDTILAKLPEVLAANPDIVYFANIFENDCWPGAAPSLSLISTRFDAYVAAVDAARLAGKKVIVQTVLPSGLIDATSAFTGYSRGNGTKAWVWLNQKIREMARARRDIILFEADLLYLDPAQTTGAPFPENTVTYLSKSGVGQALKKTESIHPLIAADWIIGKALAAVLAANFQPNARFGLPGDEQSKSANPLKGGSGGTAGPNVSGTIAAGNTLNAYVASGGGTGVASLVARSDIAGNWQRLIYSADTSADGPQFVKTGITLAPFVVGDVVQVFRECRILANPVLLQQFGNFVRFTGAGAAFDTQHGGFSGIYENSNTGQDLGQFITSDTTFTWKSAPTAIPAGTTALEIYDKVIARGIASFTVDYGREAIRKWVAVGALV